MFLLIYVPVFHDQPKKKRAMSAYMLWCLDYRPRLVEENPGIGQYVIASKCDPLYLSHMNSNV